MIKIDWYVGLPLGHVCVSFDRKKMLNMAVYRVKLLSYNLKSFILYYSCPDGKDYDILWKYSILRWIFIPRWFELNFLK